MALTLTARRSDGAVWPSIPRISVNLCQFSTVEECVLECVGGIVGVVEGAVGDGPEAFLVASDEGGEGVEVAVDVGAEQVLVAACVAGSPWHGLRLVQRGVAYVGLACWLWREVGLGMGSVARTIALPRALSIPRTIAPLGPIATARGKH